MESLIEVNNLSFKYENNSKNSLKGINLEINKGEVILLLGPSGSGKSTLALALNGIIPHTIPGKMNGTVSFQGQDNNQTPVYEITQKIGIVFQDPEAQFVSLNVEEELVFGMENLCYSTEEMEEKIIDSLKKVDMLDYRYRNVYSLSGEKNRKYYWLH
ncbi:ABC transporter ATP-binding protein [Methanobacterium petrolearium]|uniref:ABC transporter ATP-binding protein n=1 Tax=Methanobacterium petrolearium TaxID=710190 RepID=UPI003081A715|nr:hypothetical protein GCM10025861_18250 [Methanobacterium petrolearium]